MSEPEDPIDYAGEPAARRAEWFRYYSEKRIGHQWFQVHLLRDLPVQRVLEIGPNLGLVSALLANAGFAVTTLDLRPSQDPRPDIAHIQADLTAVGPDALRGFDAILCCETLEHLPWRRFADVLALFRAAEPKFLIFSVPYMGPQLDWRLYLNPHQLRHAFSFKKTAGFRRFRFDAKADPYGHKWEAGYRGHGLKAIAARIAAAGWRVRRRAFTSPTRSVFYLLEPA